MKILVIFFAAIFCGWVLPPTEAGNKPGIRFHELLPLNKKEEIRIVDDYTVEVSLGSEKKWVSSNILDALKSIPVVSDNNMPYEASFRERTIFLQQNGRYTWSQEGKDPVKLTSKDIREKGNIIIQVTRPSLWTDPISPAPSSLKREEHDQPSQKKLGNGVVNIEGFRSSKFGMTQQDVLQAILKDFKVHSAAVKRGENPT